MLRRHSESGLMLAIAAAVIGGGAYAATPDLADIRLGARDGAVTRVVLDLRGGDAPFTYSLSDDGMTLTVSLQARAASPSVPHGGNGLVRAVASTPGSDGTQISIAMDAPILVVATGRLAPQGAYKFHRIYLDLGPSTGAQMAARPEPAQAVMAESETPAEPPREHDAHREALPEEHAETRGEAHGDFHEAEPVVTIKIGGSFERSLSDYTNSAGPTAALETGLFHDALEMELGTTPLFNDGHTTWKSGLILKKPIELSETTEFEIGAGPLWLHRDYRTDGEAPTDSAGVEGVLELVVWPGEHRSLGFYAETGYSYDFGKGHEKAAGAGAGVLIPLP